MKATPGCQFFAALFLLVSHAIAVAVTGISAGVNAATGERPIRHDINELYMSGTTWDLFILALREFQRTDQDDPLSYYQVAGKICKPVVTGQ
jgi:tyrosinase